MNDDTKIIVQLCIARKIKEAREAKGWTVYKLACKSGVNASHIYRLEDGFLSARIDTLHRLCKALDIEIKVPLPI